MYFIPVMAKLQSSVSQGPKKHFLLLSILKAAVLQNIFWEIVILWSIQSSKEEYFFKIHIW